MENFRRLYVSSSENSGFTSSCQARTTFIIDVTDNHLSVCPVSGRNPYTYEINTAFGRFLDEYQTLFGKIKKYNRAYPYRFVYRTGSSGCQDTYIEFDSGNGFPARKFICHQSMFGKTSGFKCFAYDFLDLCVSGEFFGIDDEGCYQYLREQDANSDSEMKVVRPRLTQFEEGWTCPSEPAKPAVPLRTCRENELVEE